MSRKRETLIAVDAYAKLRRDLETREIAVPPQFGAPLLVREAHEQTGWPTGRWMVLDARRDRRTDSPTSWIWPPVASNDFPVNTAKEGGGPR